MAIVSLVILNGCGSQAEPTKPAKDMIKEAMTNVQDAQSLAYKLSVNADITGPEGQTPQNLKFAGDVAGLLHKAKDNDPRFTVAVDGSVQMDAQPEASLKAELRLLNKTMYVQLLNVPVAEKDLPKELADTFLNKWWSYPLPNDVLKQIGLGVATATDEEAQQVRDIYDQTNFLNPEYDGTEDVAGVSSYRYKINLDKEKFLEFVDKVSQVRKEPMSETDKAEFKKALEVITLTGAINVASQDNPYVTRAELNVAIDAKEENINGAVKLTWLISDLNKAADVTVPEGAQPFSPLLLGGLGLLGNVDQSPLTDESTLSVDGESALLDTEEDAPVKVKVK